MAPSGGQIWNYCKRRHPETKFANNASGAIWWQNLKPMQVAASGGKLLKLANSLNYEYEYFVAGEITGKINWKDKLNTVGPLCL